MASDPCSGERINLFSLVTYLPQPLGGFIDQLRGELVPGCSLQAHVTILPPRPLAAKPEAVWEHLRSTLYVSQPFEIQLNEVEIFPTSSVVYLAVSKGFAEMQNLHATLNLGPAYFPEPFPFHPHVTLAQQITEEQLSAVFHLARYRWAEFTKSRSLMVDKATFVQCTTFNTWIDLEEAELGLDSEA
jgi:2'-5' RNA ligase